MKTPALLFCIALAFPFAAVACPTGMLGSATGCHAPYQYSMNDWIRERRDYIDSLGPKGPPAPGLTREEVNALVEFEKQQKKEKEAKIAELAKGVWGVDSTSTPEGNLCAAMFVKQSTSKDGIVGGAVTIMGFQQPKPDAWLMFHGTGLPKPRNVEKLKITLQQDDEPAQTVQVFNYRYGTSREMGVVAFAVPGLAAALDGMRDKQSFKLSLDGKTLMTIQWTDGAKVIQQLKQCAK
jgi:hypothetical protein